MRNARFTLFGSIIEPTSTERGRTDDGRSNLDGTCAIRAPVSQDHNYNNTSFVPSLLRHKIPGGNAFQAAIGSWARSIACVE